MRVNAIVATDLNYGIGKNNDMPWPKNKEDMQWFKKYTMYGVVLMGRKTWESIGYECLPNRINVVLTSDANLKGPHVSMNGSNMGEILETVKNMFNRDIWIIGGGTIYKQAFPFVNRLYLTTFPDTYDCDTFIHRSEVEVFCNTRYDKTAADGVRYRIMERR